MSATMLSCTGVTATWCPVHGDCTCPVEPQTGDRPALDSDGCPLHDTSSAHGERHASCLLYAPHGACSCSTGLPGPCAVEGRP
jgi:hypothetical protein